MILSARRGRATAGPGEGNRSCTLLRERKGKTLFHRLDASDMMSHVVGAQGELPPPEASLRENHGGGGPHLPVGVCAIVFVPGQDRSAGGNYTCGDGCPCGHLEGGLPGLTCSFSGISSCEESFCLLRLLRALS